MPIMEHDCKVCELWQQYPSLVTCIYLLSSIYSICLSPLWPSRVRPIHPQHICSCQIRDTHSWIQYMHSVLTPPFHAVFWFWASKSGHVMHVSCSISMNVPSAPIFAHVTSTLPGCAQWAGPLYTAHSPSLIMSGILELSACCQLSQPPTYL